ncbi:alpha/beta hydrolase [Glycomyces buryatensis]|uniref:Alpha/beta hydrolase n=1 Tax=Glycomyces buryatensis TaxID=2570927 RepID=A0A4S8PXV9_9ACTN|nr:alpha/beta hydrolase [Glycomyces buryatensis]THV36478.1 alpha/beta hydrolase [Glycomyces buryatensis]
MQRRRIVGIGVTLAAAAGLTATLVTLPAIADDGDASKVDWGACPEDVTGAERLECATVPVPLDYDEPDGTRIDVMISRLASQNEADRRGVLMLNPGGPGGAGLSQPTDLVDLGLPNGVSDAYDLIGMDPRGVGHSSPVSCGFTTDQDYGANVPPFAVDEAAVAERAAIAEGVAEQCAANDPDGLMQHMTTANTARDMDWIRQALGEEKINFYGSSYGSSLGSAYASLFPEHSDRIVIDSNGGDTALDFAMQRRWGPGVEESFPTFAAWAAERHDSYGLGQTPEEVREGYFALAQQLDEQPVDIFDGPMFRFYVFFTLYKESSYGPMARLWESLAASDEDEVRRQADQLDLPVPASRADGTEGAAEPSPFDNALSAYLAVTCNDTDWPEDVATYQDAVAADREEYPMFGGAGGNITPCAFWHNDPLEPQVAITDEGPANVLVLQNERDVATPLEGGHLVSEAFGDRARLVTVDDDGHGVYVYGDNPCALNITTDYLVDGEFPESDVRCEASDESGLDLDDTGQQQRAEALDRLGL